VAAAGLCWLVLTGGEDPEAGHRCLAGKHFTAVQIFSFCAVQEVAADTSLM